MNDAPGPAAPISPRTLHGARVLLRLWQPDDAPAMHEICQDSDIQRWSGLPVPYRIEDAHDYINTVLPKELETGTGVSFAITLPDEGGAAVGSTGLYSIRPRTSTTPATASVRVWLAPTHRKSGLATEAMRLLAAWAFADLRLDRITGYYYPGNTTVRRLNELVGFANHGTLRAAVLSDGTPADLWYSDLVPEDLAPGPAAPHGEWSPTADRGSAR